MGPGIPRSRSAGCGRDIRLTSNLLLTRGALTAAVQFAPKAWRRAGAALALVGFFLAAWMLAGRDLQAPALAAVAATMLLARTALWRLVSSEVRANSFTAVALRLAAVWALSVLFLAMLALLLFIALLCFAYAAASTGKGFDPANVVTWAPAVSQRGGLLVTAMTILGAAGWVFAAARIALAEAATVARRRVQVLSVWALSRGRVAPILFANAALAALPAAAFVLLPTPPAGLALIAIRVLQSLVLAGLWLPMSVGLMAYVLDNCTGTQPDP